MRSSEELGKLADAIAACAEEYGFSLSCYGGHRGMQKVVLGEAIKLMEYHLYDWIDGRVEDEDEDDPPVPDASSGPQG